jgi:hypothetical protein
MNLSQIYYDLYQIIGSKNIYEMLPLSKELIFL